MSKRLRASKSHHSSLNLRLAGLNRSTRVIDSRVIKEQSDQRNHGSLESPPDSIPTTKLVQLSGGCDILNRLLRHLATFLDGCALLQPQGNIWHAPHSIAEQCWTV